MKVYKFRSLANAEAHKWTMDIINTGAFWHARFWTMNDPMEGLYATRKGTPMNQETLYPDKARLLICSFSAEPAIRSPAMWGYYAGGFKGAVIEVDIADSSPGHVEYVKKVQYLEAPFALRDVEKGVDAAREALCHKLDAWRHEHEWRSIVDLEHTPDGRPGMAIRTGTITRVYIGDPLREVKNRDEIYQKAPDWRAYQKRSEGVLLAARDCGIETSVAYVKGAQVTFAPGGCASS